MIIIIIYIEREIAYGKTRVFHVVEQVETAQGVLVEICQLHVVCWYSLGTDCD